MLLLAQRVNQTFPLVFFWVRSLSSSSAKFSLQVAMPLLDEQRESLWKCVVERWDEEATHATFLEYCRRTDALSDAATRYRGMSGDRDRGPEAQRRLQGVVVLATQAMMTQRSSPPQKAQSWLFVLVAVLCSVGVGYSLFRLLSLR